MTVANSYLIISFDMICSGLLSQEARCDIVLYLTPWSVMRPRVMRYNLPPYQGWDLDWSAREMNGQLELILTPR